MLVSDLTLQDAVPLTANGVFVVNRVTMMVKVESAASVLYVAVDDVVQVVSMLGPVAETLEVTVVVVMSVPIAVLLGESSIE